MKFRHEYKHKINLSDILQLRHRLKAVMEQSIKQQADKMSKLIADKLGGELSVKSSLGVVTTFTLVLPVI